MLDAYWGFSKSWHVTLFLTGHQVFDPVNRGTQGGSRRRWKENTMIAPFMPFLSGTRKNPFAPGERLGAPLS
jgi:hypothetical protein